MKNSEEPIVLFLLNLMNINVCFVKSGVPINMQANDNMIFAELAWKYFGKVGIDQQNDQPKFIFNSKEIKLDGAKTLKELDGYISDLNKEIKKYITEKNEYPKDKIVDLMKKLLYINHFIKNRVCNQEDKN